MKKVSLIITAVALTAGLSTALAAKHAPKASNFATIYRYTQGNVVLITATRATAEASTECPGGTFHCANAWTTGTPAQHVSEFDIFQPAQ